eukprot:339801-Rhodomonas_salina.2
MFAFPRVLEPTTLRIMASTSAFRGVSSPRADADQYGIMPGMPGWPKTTEAGPPTIIIGCG